MMYLDRKLRKSMDVCMISTSMNSFESPIVILLFVEITSKNLTCIILNSLNKLGNPMLLCVVVTSIIHVIAHPHLVRHKQVLR